MKAVWLAARGDRARERERERERGGGCGLHLGVCAGLMKAVWLAARGDRARERERGGGVWAAPRSVCTPNEGGVVSSKG